MSDENEQLISACRDNDISEARRLLLTGMVDVNYKNKHGSTALIIACLNGHVDVARMLLAEFRADVNLTNNHGFSALMYACGSNHIDIARMLLQEFRADFNLATKNGKTALDYCNWSSKSRIETIIFTITFKSRVQPVSAIMHPSSSAAEMPPPPTSENFFTVAELSRESGTPAVELNGESEKSEQKAIIDDRIETLQAERNCNEEELNRVRAQLRVSNEERDRAVEENNRLQKQFGLSIIWWCLYSVIVCFMLN